MTTEPNDSIERIVAELREYSESKIGKLLGLGEIANRLEKLSAASVQVTRPAEAVLENDCIVIRLPVAFLKTAVAGSPAFEHFDDETCSYLEPIITDAQAFAMGVIGELNSESENGTTLVHIMFDKAFNEAVEQGTEGIVLPSQPEYAALRLSPQGEDNG